MQSWLTEVGARLILATRLIDRSYDLIDRARSLLVLAVASDAVLARFNCLAYGGSEMYQLASSTFRRHLFLWEKNAIATYFPPPPARVLIGGAGGGREVLALAEMGYEVVAFEPSAALAATMAEGLPKELNARVFRASYEDMPQLFPARPEQPCGTLEAEPDFNAAVLGWSSYSHLRTEEQRIRTLCSFARHVHGPILISFNQFAAHKITPRRTWSDCIRRTLKIKPGDSFSVKIGFTHDVSASELTTIAERSGLLIVHLNESNTDGNWPHAVLCPLDLASQFRARVQPAGVLAKT